ncbi:hypothetical protein SUGI_0005290 [Cryptomeria japonica]|nr:hypothetical protein SUGI_0005290 [Cryptomeria japonica]
MACNFLCAVGRHGASLSLHSSLRRASQKTRTPLPPKYTQAAASSSSTSLAHEDNADSQLHNGEGRAFESRKKSYFPKKNEVVELVCESLAFKGKGVCKIAESGFVVMCDRALPGERFIGRITRIKKGRFAEVKKLKTLSPHNNCVIAPCEHAIDCGGCKTQNLAYEAQVKAKEQQVRELMVHIGRFPIQGHEDYMKPIVPCDVQFHYRNKMEFSFGTKSWLPEDTINGKDGREMNKPALGLHVPGCFDKILPIKNCLLQHKVANHVLAIVQECWQDPMSNLSAYDVYKHNGFLKHLTIRTGRDYDTGSLQIMVNLVTSCYKPTLLQPIVKKIVDTIPEVVSILNSVNTSVGNTSIGEEEYVLHGNNSITETLRGLTFEISANSFFQTNTQQADVLYSLVEAAASLRGDSSEIVLDLFCGTGTIGLTLAKKVKYVYGYEVVPEAVADARRNAARNDIQNAKFIQGDLNKVGDDFGNEFPHPDIVITDPNRPGMHTKLIRFLLKLRAPRIIYVSCNPATCARDLDYLCHGLPESKILGAYRLKIKLPRIRESQ